MFFISLLFPGFSFLSLFNYFCLSRFDLRAFRWVQTMVFAIEEINRNPRLLPGVKVGYRILDSCDHVHTSLQSAFSLVNESSLPQTEGSAARSIFCLSKAPVPAIIGLASSTPTRAVAQTFGPFEIPMVSLNLMMMMRVNKRNQTLPCKMYHKCRSLTLIYFNIYFTLFLLPSKPCCLPVTSILIQSEVLWKH